MLIWLIARAHAGKDDDLPRRLVYVVDRRVVVDQATSEAEKIAEKLENTSDPVISDLCERLGVCPDRPLSISTLRGGKAETGNGPTNPPPRRSSSAPST